MKKTAHHTFTGTIVCLSGLRIGGSDDLLQTGGTDLTCIKHPVTLQPYIPGSSLKGRLRSEMEQREGKFSGRDENEPCACARDECLICRVFGPHKAKSHKFGPSRLIVRDCPVTKGGETELKTENVIDRKTGQAMHPRKVERVVAGSEFGFKLALQVWDVDNLCKFRDDAGKDHTGPAALLEFLRCALRRVQRTGLGSGVSKGSGEIEFRNLKLHRDGAAQPEDFPL